MIKPITLTDTITHQAKKLEQAKGRKRINETTVYQEKLILDIMKEHQRMIKKEGQLFTVQMSPERFDKFQNIY